jgi:hypothetical protein
MSTESISLNLKTDFAKQYKESFSLKDPRNVAYVFIGKNLPYPNESVPDEITSTLVDEKSTWQNIYAGKKILPGNIEFVVPRVDWAANRIYKQFDDTIELSYLVSDQDTTQPMYVLTDEGNVYKCLCNDGSNLSTIKPSGDYSSSNGIIFTGDGYLWKYMYNVNDSNKFLTPSWMPVPYSIDDVIPIEYNMSANNYVDGGLSKIITTNGGSGYIHSNVVVNSFTTGNTFLTIPAGNTTANIANNMFISGVGIAPKTHVVGVSNELNRITLSKPTTGIGGGVSNTVYLTTRADISGDGIRESTTTSVALNSGVISKITVTSTGTGFSYANVIIYGTGSSATARAVLPPKYGHAYYPAIELGCKNIMIVVSIGEVDASENGLISTNTTFRQYGVLSAPHKYGNTKPVIYDQANTAISQTTDITLLSSGSYDLNERVYQNQDGVEVFSGYVNAQENNIVRLTNISGRIAIGSLLLGSNSSVSRPVSSVKNPEFEPYSGKLLYTKNIISVERSEGQEEELKLVIHF